MGGCNSQSLKLAVEGNAWEVESDCAELVGGEACYTCKGCRSNCKQQKKLSMQTRGEREKKKKNGIPHIKVSQGNSLA